MFDPKAVDLSQAALQNPDSLAQQLLAAGAGIDIVLDWSYRSPLFLAARLGDLKMVQMLLDAGAEVDAADHGSRSTPLHAAAESGCTEVVQLLLSAGAKADAEDSNHKTPFYVAAAKGRHDLIQLLLAAGVVVDASDDESKTSLHAAAKAGHSQVVQLLLAAGAKVDAAGKCGSTPLIAAAAAGHPEVVHLLLAAGAETQTVNFKCKTAKHAAAGKGHLEVAQLLLAAGTEMNEVPTHRPASPLDAAVAQGRSEMVQLAAGARADATHDDRCPPMLVAAQAGYFKVVQLLLAASANVNPPDSYGWTPLHVAAARGHLGVVQLLLEAWGMSVPAVDLVGAVKTAAFNGCQKSLALLIKELWKLHPAELQQLFEGEYRVPVADTLAAVLDAWASDVSSKDEQWATVREQEEDAAREKRAVQQLLVGVAGIAKAAQQRLAVGTAHNNG